MAGALEITERRVGPVTIVDLNGQLVVDDGEREFRQTIDVLVAAGQLNVLIDLSKVTYMDSGGVGALVAKYLHVTKRGGQMKLLHLSRRANRVLRTARLVSVFEVFRDEAEAVSSFALPAPLVSLPAPAALMRRP
jgi:anti-sigma B factor antagonist